MKKFLEKHAGGLMISFCSAVLIIIGLSGWICLDFVGDDRREELYRTEADSAAYRLMDSLDEGDNILAYHYAQLVRDNAAKSGQRNTAEIFAGLSETIRITGITDAVKQAVTDYLENGEDPPEEKTEISALPDVPDEPEDVAVLRRNDAMAAAEEIMGTSGLLTMAVRCREGEFLFTCRNAYAVIDEKTSLPVEIGISLPKTEESRGLSPEECEVCADEFLRKYFPSAQVQSSRVYPGEDCVTVEYRLDGRIVRASVRRDSGRVVRYTAR
ncbi:MAG: hypothetical protein IJF78_01600 [Clostridia bacterium]|nr:hypothetical protein [Clostridia bacterium]